MCDLCSQDAVEVKGAKQALKGEAAALRFFADELDRLANGDVKPHSEIAKLMMIQAKGHIRYLVTDWL